ncbi:MAG: alpha/beta hydrolase family protein [Actinomycetota bacterium]
MKIAGVSAAWDRPDDARAVLVLAHGAGGDLNDPFLRGLGASLAEAGIATVRFNFPYRESGRKAPGAQSQSEDCYREIVTHVRAEGVPTFCGGKSYGGRVATHIAAADVPMSGLVLLSYPLHPPGKPERLRDAHLADVSAPMLFVQGSRDPFATPALLDKTVRSLDAATLVHVEGGDHSLNVRGRPRADVVDEVSAIVRGFVARS